MTSEVQRHSTTSSQTNDTRKNGNRDFSLHVVRVEDDDTLDECHHLDLDQEVHNQIVLVVTYKSYSHLPETTCSKELNACEDEIQASTLMFKIHEP
ncbi:uncharacterized protein V6R79_003004 [Siganus canaliculatus]